MASEYTNFSRPVFQAGQALKSIDLNNMVDYLETQDRLTRAYLIGSGVFYGLHWTCEDTGNGFKLCISKGAGVSSEGHLFAIKLEKDIDGKELPCCLDAGRVFKMNYTDFNPSLLPKDLPPSNTPGVPQDQFDVFELIKTPANGLPDEFNNNIDVPKDQCLVLYWDTKVSSRKNCIDSCDGAGGDKALSMRFFLMSEDDLKVIWRNMTPGSTGGGGGFSGLMPFLRRLHKAKDLETMNAPSDLYGGWKAVVQEAIGTVAAPGNIPIAVSTALGGTPTAAQLQAKFKTLLDGVSIAANEPQLQYLNDYLCDLVATVNEIAALTTQSVLTLCPDETLFPKFIAVGMVGANNVNDPCRMPYYRLPTEGSGDAQTEKLEFLKAKLLCLVTTPEPLLPLPDPKSQEVRITGSDFKSLPLSAQAIPYYYRDLNSLRSKWNFELSRASRSQMVQAFEAPGDYGLGDAQSPLATPADAYPRSVVCYDLKGETFFRIEGHINKPLKEGAQAVEKLRKALNLPFKLVILRLSPKPNIIYNGNNNEVLEIINQMQFNEFAKDHPGMEHMAGVPTGGTFIIVFKEEIPAEFIQLFESPNTQPSVIESLLPNVIRRTIVADFCLPYGCYSGPNVKYCFEEEIVNTPQCIAEADFEEKKINELQYIFENRSPLADIFKWEVFKSENGQPVGTAIVSQTFTKGTDPNVLADFAHTFDYGEYVVRLTATCTEDHLTDTSEKVYLFCPDEQISITYLDSDGTQQFSLVVEEGTDQEFTFTGAPAGGTWDLDEFNSSEMGAPIEKTKDTLVLNFKDLKLEVDSDDNPVEESFLIMYTFPCDGASVEFLITVNPPAQIFFSRVSNIQNPAALELQADYQRQANEIADSALKNAPAFKKAMNFLQTPPPDSESVFDKFDDVVTKISSTLKEPGKLDPAQLQALLQNATHLFLDRLVLETDPGLQADALKKFQRLALTLKAQNINLKNWQGASFTTDTKLLKTITKTL